MPVCSRISLFEKGHQNITSIFLASDAVYSIFSLLIPEVNTFSWYQIVISILCLSLASIYICLLISPSPPDRTRACTPSFSHQGHPSVSLGLHHVIHLHLFPSIPPHPLAIQTCMKCSQFWWKSSNLFFTLRLHLYKSNMASIVSIFIYNVWLI